MPPNQASGSGGSLGAAVDRWQVSSTMVQVLGECIAVRANSSPAGIKEVAHLQRCPQRPGGRHIPRRAEDSAPYLQTWAAGSALQSPAWPPLSWGTVTQAVPVLVLPAASLHWTVM